MRSSLIEARWEHLKDWPEGQRLCYKCNTLKSLEDFGAHKGCYQGRNSRCKACVGLKSKAEYAGSAQEYRMWYRAKRRAKVEGIAFDIEVSDVAIPAACPVFGTPFEIGNPDTTPSLDKLIPALGYVKGNVHVISNRANRLKNDATLEELERIISYIQWPDLQLPPLNLYNMPKLAR